MAKKADPRKAALDALSKAALLPAPVPLFGTKAKPGIFLGNNATTRAAAEVCEEEGWVKGTGEFVGRGRTQKELHRVTAGGLQAVVQESETGTMLREILSALDAQRADIGQIGSQLAATEAALAAQTSVIGRLQNRIAEENKEAIAALQSVLAPRRPPPAPVRAPEPQQPKRREQDTTWHAAALEYLRNHKRMSGYGACHLVELYKKIAAPRGLTIGQFHDGVRALAQQDKVRLHAFTRGMHYLQDSEYALVAGQEVNDRVEVL